MEPSQTAISGNGPRLLKDQLQKEGKRRVAAHTSHLLLSLLTSSHLPSLPLYSTSSICSAEPSLALKAGGLHSSYHFCRCLSPIYLVSSLEREGSIPGAFLSLSPLACAASVCWVWQRAGAPAYGGPIAWLPHTLSQSQHNGAIRSPHASPAPADICTCGFEAMESSLFTLMPVGAALRRLWGQSA